MNLLQKTITCYPAKKLPKKHPPNDEIARALGKKIPRRFHSKNNPKTQKKSPLVKPLYIQHPYVNAEVHNTHKMHPAFFYY